MIEKISTAIANFKKMAESFLGSNIAVYEKISKKPYGYDDPILKKKAIGKEYNTDQFIPSIMDKTALWDYKNLVLSAIAAKNMDRNNVEVGIFDYLKDFHSIRYVADKLSSLSYNPNIDETNFGIHLKDISVDLDFVRSDLDKAKVANAVLMNPKGLKEELQNRVLEFEKFIASLMNSAKVLNAKISGMNSNNILKTHYSIIVDGIISSIARIHDFGIHDLNQEFHNVMDRIEIQKAMNEHSTEIIKCAKYLQNVYLANIDAR